MQDVEKILTTYGIDPLTWQILKNEYPHLADDEYAIHLADIYKSSKDRGIPATKHFIIGSLITNTLGTVEFKKIYTVEAFRKIAHSDPTWGGIVFEYGPDTTVNIAGIDITGASWVSAIVSRVMPNGATIQTSSRELLTENVTLDSMGMPTQFWRTRPTGQLAIRAEAQVLRKAFSIADGYTEEESQYFDGIINKNDQNSDFVALVGDLCIPPENKCKAILEMCNQAKSMADLEAIKAKIAQFNDGTPAHIAAIKNAYENAEIFVCMEGDESAEFDPDAAFQSLIPEGAKVVSFGR